MKKIKKLLAGFTALLVLTGCSYLDAERVDCYECGDSVTRWIDLASGEHVCATCFEKRGYQVCLECGAAYIPGDSDDVDGYCGSCAERDTWYCIQCDEPKSLENLVEVDDGYYMCVKCLYIHTKAYDNAFKSTYADYVSPFDWADALPGQSRNEELGIDSDWTDDTESNVLSDPEYYFYNSYDDGYSEGYADGKSDGYSEGKTAGYNSGYSKGFSEGKASVKTTTSTASTASSSSSSSGGTSTPAVSEPQSVTVYITNTGSKYHRSGCQYLRKSCIPISLDNAKSRGYTACSKCW